MTQVSTATQPVPTAKQRERLAQLENTDAKITGWHVVWRGPMVLFPTGALFVITRDGGLLKL